MRFATVLGTAATAAVLGVTALLYVGSRHTSSEAALTPTPSVTSSTSMASSPTLTQTSTPLQSRTTSAAPRSRTRSASPTQSRATQPTATQPSSSAAPSPARTSSSTPKPAPSVPPAAAQLPLAGDTRDATQVITVKASGWGVNRATLQAWTKVSGGWRQVGPSVGVWLGSPGFTTQAREGYDGTPVGNFPITQAFGNNSNPGTSLPYFHSGTSDWWVGDVNSPLYNTHQHCAVSLCSFDTSKSENLGSVGWVYGYAVVINYNMNPVRAGGGSAFFLHVTDGSPTAGCVAMPQADIVRLLTWLTPATHPRLLMGVN